MYLWRRFGTERWAKQNEEKLRTVAGNELAIIERPDRQRLQFEVACEDRADLQNLAKQFGGRIEKLPNDWLKRSLRQKTKPIKIGSRQLTIPAAAAFGTGEHATTAMCLRMLERVIRFWGAHPPSPAGDRALAIANFTKKGFPARRQKEHPRRVRSPALVVDLGTGSGIVSLAAKVLGARRVIGLDNDPIAISTAKQNAKLNKIRGVKFRVADVREWQLEREVDVVIANLFSELLIEIMPNLRTVRRVILSGILRDQETDVRQALTRAKFEILEVRKRGKWVAMLAGHR